MNQKLNHNQSGIYFGMVKKKVQKRATMKLKIKTDPTIEKDDNQLCGGKVIGR